LLLLLVYLHAVDAIRHHQRQKGRPWPWHPPPPSKQFNISFLLPSGYTSLCEFLHLFSSSAVTPILKRRKYYVIKLKGPLKIKLARLLTAHNTCTLKRKAQKNHTNISYAALYT
jgi:hypothetical protein